MDSSDWQIRPVELAKDAQRLLELAHSALPFPVPPWTTQDLRTLAGVGAVADGTGSHRVDVIRIGTTIEGAISYCIEPPRQTGAIRWLIGAETPFVATSLLRHATSAMSDVGVVAFKPIWPTYFGLPDSAGHLAETALLELGFAKTTQWQVYFRDLPASGLPQLRGYKLENGQGDGELKLVVKTGPNPVATIDICRPRLGVGLIAEPRLAPEGHGLGSLLLGSACDLLAGMGARSVLLLGQPAGPNDMPRAQRIYATAGFKDVGRTSSFGRPKPHR